jgi:hypothetical protein
MIRFSHTLLYPRLRKNEKKVSWGAWLMPDEELDESGTRTHATFVTRKLTNRRIESQYAKGEP